MKLFTRVRRRIHRRCKGKSSASGITLIGLLLSLSGCILTAAFSMSGWKLSDVSRALPRVTREHRRNSVDWQARLIQAQLSPPTNVPFSLDQVHVISLRRTNRSGHLTQQLKKLGIPYVIDFAVDGFDAFSASDISKYAGARRRKRFNPSILEQDIRIDPFMTHEKLRFGCYLSHVHLWEQIVAFRHSYFLILEDDVYAVDSFANDLKRLWSQLPSHWDILYLNSCHTKLGGRVSANILQVRGALCTHGYIISFNGARKLLKKTALNSDKPVDHMLDEAIYSSVLSAYHASPSLIFPRNIESTLEYPT